MSACVQNPARMRSQRLRSFPLRAQSGITAGVGACLHLPMQTHAPRSCAVTAHCTFKLCPKRHLRRDRLPRDGHTVSYGSHRMQTAMWTAGAANTDPPGLSRRRWHVLRIREPRRGMRPDADPPSHAVGCDQKNRDVTRSASEPSARHITIPARAARSTDACFRVSTGRSATARCALVDP